MSHESEFQEMLRAPHFRPIEGGLAKDRRESRDREKEKEKEGEEESCAAFGYLRGLTQRAEAVRFCFRDGTSLCLPYSWLGPWEHNPSVGLLLKFTGDLVTLVLIRGSNFDVLVNGSINLTDRGLQRHRIIYVREMDEDELARAGEEEPTVDGIEAASFNAPDKLRQWVSQRAPAFLRGTLVPS